MLKRSWVQFSYWRTELLRLPVWKVEWSTNRESTTWNQNCSQCKSMGKVLLGSWRDT